LDKFFDEQARILGDAREVSLFLAEDIAHSKLWTGQKVCWT
jgi:hypothetical protein